MAVLCHKKTIALVATATFVSIMLSLCDHHKMQATFFRMGDNDEVEFKETIVIPGTESESLLENSFEAWAKAHKKRYASPDERLRRYQNFEASIHKIMEHNAKKDSKHKLGLTQYADFTDEEFNDHFQFWPKKHDCWTAVDRAAMEQNKLTNAGIELPFLPKAIDWREKGIVGPVKNQGNCGSCWAFSATGALEAHYAKKYGRQIILSEQQLLDCSYGYGDFGCSGGFPSRAFEYVRRSGGLDSAESYPYEMKSNGTDSCRFRKTDAAARVHRVVNVTESNEHELQQAVAFEGPVTVAFVVTPDFRLYSGGVFSSPDCGSPKPKDLTHAVLVVGFGVTEDGIKYWIVKNSWGEGWGLHGYFFMERGNNMCGISDCAAYPVMQ